MEEMFLEIKSFYVWEKGAYFIMRGHRKVNANKQVIIPVTSPVF